MNFKPCSVPPCARERSRHHTAVHLIWQETTVVFAAQPLTWSFCHLHHSASRTKLSSLRASRYSQSSTTPCQSTGHTPWRQWFVDLPHTVSESRGNICTTGQDVCAPRGRAGRPRGRAGVCRCGNQEAIIHHCCVLTCGTNLVIVSEGGPHQDLRSKRPRKL